MKNQMMNRLDFLSILSESEGTQATGISGKGVGRVTYSVISKDNSCKITPSGFGFIYS
jgi:hypothetical protein